MTAKQKAHQALDKLADNCTAEEIVTAINRCLAKDVAKSGDSKNSSTNSATKTGGVSMQQWMTEHE